MLSEAHINSNNYNDEASLYDIPVYNFIKKNRGSRDLEKKKDRILKEMSYKVYGLKYFHKTPKVFFYLPSIDPLTDGNIFLKISTLYLMTPLNVISSKPKECIIMGDTNINYLDKNNHSDINIFLC